MKHSDMRTLARGLALDRDSAVSGSVASTDPAHILNDHIATYGATNSDRSSYYTATAGGFSVANGGFSARLQTNILKILGVTRESGASSIDGTPVEIVTPGEIYHARLTSTTAGTPSMVAFTRLAGDSNRIRAIVHPPSSGGHYFSLHYWNTAPEFTIATIDDTEVCDYPDHAQYMIVREAAVDIAMILDQPDEIIESIMAQRDRGDELATGMLARNQGPNPPTDRPK